jgi:hypothetical protein
MGYVVTGDGPSKMKELTVKLKTADPMLKRELRRALKDAASGAADAARASILSMPGAKVGKPPLRESVANSVTVRVGLASAIQVSITAEPNKMPPGEGNMPKKLNEATFSHPVFGDRKVWVKQRGKSNWFDDSITRAGPDAQQKISDAMDVTAEYIAGGL